MHLSQTGLLTYSCVFDQDSLLSSQNFAGQGRKVISGGKSQEACWNSAICQIVAIFLAGFNTQCQIKPWSWQIVSELLQLGLCKRTSSHQATQNATDLYFSAQELLQWKVIKCLSKLLLSETAQEPNSVNDNNNSTEKLRRHTLHTCTLKPSCQMTNPITTNKTINYSKLITYTQHPVVFTRGMFLLAVTKLMCITTELVTREDAKLRISNNVTVNSKILSKLYFSIFYRELFASAIWRCWFGTRRASSCKNTAPKFSKTYLWTHSVSMHRPKKCL